MTDVDVDFISLVNKGANKLKVQIYKADDYEPETLNDDENIEEVTGFFNAVKSFFTGEEVKKADKKAVKGFNDRILTVEVMDNIWRVNDALVSTMRDVLNDSNLKDKESFLNTAIDEHVIGTAFRAMADVSGMALEGLNSAIEESLGKINELNNKEIKDKSTRPVYYKGADDEFYPDSNRTIREQIDEFNSLKGKRKRYSFRN